MMLYMTKKPQKKDEKILELEGKISELTFGWQRCLADFQNFKRKVEEERSNTKDEANFNLLYELLPILDNFQLAAKHIPKEIEANNWAIGIRQIEKQFETILFDLGLTKIETLGQEFNPSLHEAIETVRSGQHKGVIVEEIMAGYQFKNKVIRPAKVKVSN